jgi:hypothetical protein
MGHKPHTIAIINFGRCNSREELGDLRGVIGSSRGLTLRVDMVSGSVLEPRL